MARISRIWAVLSALFLLAGTVHSVPSGLPAGVWTEDFLRDIGITTDFTFISSDKLLIARKNGLIDLYKSNGGTWQFSNVVVDLSGQVVDYADRGAMGLTIHPNFPSTPYIYISIVFDSAPGDPAGWKQNRLLRYSMYGDYADPASQVILIGKCNNKVAGWYGGDCSPMLGTTHAIGWADFGNDGMLYVAVGEGQTQEGGDWTKYGDMIPTSWALAMDPDFLGGKILRIDPNTGKGLPDNPFWDGDSDSSRSRVWAVGLRNPFKCAFAPGKQEILCGNVGWYLWEMVAVLWRGSNAGWPCYEGDKIATFPNNEFPACQAFYDGTSGYPPADLARSAAFTWSHDGVSSASIGGDFFPSTYPASVANKFLFADFSKSIMFTMSWSASGYGSTTSFGSGMDNPVAMKLNKYDGRMYYLGHCTGCDTYGVMRVFNYAGWKPTAPVGPPAPPPPPPPPPVNGIKGWFCAPNFTAPVRIQDGNAVCIADPVRKGVCARQKDAAACLALANNPPADVGTVVCTAASYKDPRLWCARARSWLQGTWQCIPKAGFYYPVKINSEGSASCLSTGAGCLWSGPLSKCQATAAQPPSNAVEKKCASSLNSNMGNVCGQAWKWLDGPSVPVILPWRCLGDGTGVGAPVFVRNGNIFCMSTDGGKSCTNAGSNSTACTRLIQLARSKPAATPLQCTLANYKTPGHLCKLAFNAIGGGWQCLDGIPTPVKLDGKAIANCMVGKDGACLAMAKTGECVAAVLNAPASVGSVTCAYADYIDPKNTWCAKATGVLKGKAPLPPREFCYNKAVTLPDLPSGWSVIMRPNMFPEVTYVRNGPGAGPVEVDASVGGVLPNDGQQITVSGNRYSYGLGVRASSEVKVTFRGKCYALVTDVGVDDEMKGMGGGEFVVRTQSLAETILANSTALRNGIFMRGGTEPFTMTVNNLHTLMGVRLQANRPSTYTVGNITMDHLDWADIRFLCGPDAPYLPKVQASVTFVKGGTGTAKRAKVGDIVAFSGSARDFNGSPISVDRFEWFINLVHCQGPLCHTHFVQQIPASAGLPSVASGQLTIDDHPLDGNQYFYFQIRFAATDVCGRRNYVDKNIIVDKV